MLFGAETMSNNINQFFSILLIFIFVLLLTWLTTRYIAGFQKGKLRGSNIEIIDSFRISQNKVIQIIKITDKYIAIAVCKDTVTVLTEISSEALTFKDSHTNTIYTSKPIE